jgi:competence protein ComEA
MGIPRGLTVSGLLAAASFLLALPGAAQSDLPDGPGKPVVQKVCSGCHAFTVITQVRGTKDHWEAIVENMVSRGAEGSDEELDKVVAYLAAHFGPADDAHRKINVNKATAEELARTLSVSRESANAIVQYRAKNGNFKNLEALKNVPGIDVKQIDENKDRIEF